MRFTGQRFRFFPGLPVAAFWIALLCAALSAAPDADGEATLVGVLLRAGAEPEAAAEACGAAVVKAVPAVEDAWVFRPHELPVGAEAREALLVRWREHSMVLWAEWQERREHAPREGPPAAPGPLQWHLANTGQAGGRSGLDIHVRGAWEAGYSGRGVVMAIVDDGVDTTHPGLVSRYRSDLDRNFHDGPEDDGGARGAADNHGTAVAGIAAAGDGQSCGPGVAPAADLLSLRLIAGPTTDILEASALGHGRDSIDIYNCSWGPDQANRLRLAPMGFFTRRAIEQSIETGRAGRGNIFVWAAGNSGESEANTNYDGYVNSRYTIGVGAVDRHGRHSPWSVPGAALMVVAPSGDAAAGVLTLDRTGAAGETPGDCYSFFTGTSAATPMVAGVVALMLEANPDLGWRDVQHILARTARKVDAGHSGWITNAAGFTFNDFYGFGLLDATAAVAMAERWPTLPAAQTASYSYAAAPVAIPAGGEGARIALNVPESLRLEHVEVVFRSDHPDWGKLEIELTGPGGVSSRLMEVRGDRNRNYNEWRFLTLRHWGESAAGEWSLRVRDSGGGGSGRITGGELRLHGLPAHQFPALVGPPREAKVEPAAFPFRFDPRELFPELPPGLAVLSARADYGTAAVDAAGHIEYRPAVGRAGVETVRMILADALGGVVHRSVRVEVGAPPRKVSTAVLGGDTVVPFPLPVGPGGTAPAPSSHTLHRGPFHGTIVHDASSGRFAYTPLTGHTGADEVVFRTSGPGPVTEWTWLFHIDRADTSPPALTLEHAAHGAVLGAGFPSLRDAFSLAAWIHPAGWGDVGTSGYGRVFDKGSLSLFLCGADNPFYPEASLVLFLEHAGGGEGAVTTGPGTLGLGTWQHVLVTYDGAAEVRAYLDGRPAGLSAATGIPLPAGPLADHTAEPLHFGNTSAGHRPFLGRMALPQVWDRALTPDEAAAVARGDPPPAAGLLGAWDFAEGAGMSIRDSVSGQAGYLAGGGFAPWTEPPAHYAAFVGWTPAGGGGYRGRGGEAVAAAAYPWVYLARSGWSYADARRDGWLWLRDLEADGAWMAVAPGDTALRWFADEGKWAYVGEPAADGSRRRYCFSSVSWESW